MAEISKITLPNGQIYAIKDEFARNALDGKQDKLTFDTTPTAGSTKPVTSGGIKTALDGKANVSHTHTIVDVTVEGVTYTLTLRQERGVPNLYITKV